MSCMRASLTDQTVWKILFFALPLGYCWCYAPFGINETDGGFITGLAWQLLSGKNLYTDVVYVRPPLPVWLRAVELYLLPENWAVLGERWLFYWKVAAYAWLGAAVLSTGAQQWRLAVWAFVMSAHCYPAAAWHTVDGLLFGSLGLWLWFRGRGAGAAFGSGTAVAAMLLCKQSFYPMLPLWLALVIFEKNRLPRHRRWALAGAVVSLGLFATGLYAQNALGAFLQLTRSASSGGQAFEHGVLDYLRLAPAVARPAVALLARSFWLSGRRAPVFWYVFLLFLAGSYALAIGIRQEFTAPFTQTRLLFGLAAGYALWSFYQKNWPLEKSLAFAALLALSWSASVSWGYNLPILFALPWVFVLLEMSDRHTKTLSLGRLRFALLALAGALLLFRWGYTYVYRDGRRPEMTVSLGAIFPKLSGIYSTPDRAALYQDLQNLSQRYGPGFKTLPTFPLANFITGTQPPLPLDWVVKREMGAGRLLVDQTRQQTRPHLLVEKSQWKKIQSDPEMELVRSWVSDKTPVDSTAYFLVFSPD
ncbi:MAG: hypothetical protein JNK89_02390 [Saprospiraceae bacterium]|nr:hypothetical protein [Saprospiraceae bacterium]